MHATLSYAAAVLVLVQGEAGSLMRASDVIRIKPACQLPADVLRSAQGFTRHSPAYPPNAVRLIPKVCFTAALTSPDPQQHCFTDALKFDSFSLLAAYNDPDKGSQYPGYVLFQANTTRVCQAVVSRECLEQSNGDEELCMAMLIAASGIGTAPNKASSSGGSFGWSPGTAAAVAVAGEGRGCRRCVSGLACSDDSGSGIHDLLHGGNLRALSVSRASALKFAAKP